jgi:hypothetical protein
MSLSIILGVAVLVVALAAIVALLRRRIARRRRHGAIPTWGALYRDNLARAHERPAQLRRTRGMREPAEPQGSMHPRVDRSEEHAEDDGV